MSDWARTALDKVGAVKHPGTMCISPAMKRRMAQWSGLAATLLFASGCGYFSSPPPRTAQRAAAAQTQSTPVSETAPETVTAQRPASPQRLLSGFRQMDLKDTVIDALARIGADAVDPLVQTLADPDPAVRLAAARALAAIGPEAERSVPALIRALEDRDEAVRQAAARALGQIGPSANEAVPALLRVLREEAVRHARDAETQRTYDDR